MDFMNGIKEGTYEKQSRRGKLHAQPAEILLDDGKGDFVERGKKRLKSKEMQVLCNLCAKIFVIIVTLPRLRFL